MSSSAALPVNPFPLRESDLDWMTVVGTWQSSSAGLLTQFDQDGSSLKMSPDYCRQTKEGILLPSSHSWGNAGMGSHTGFLTLNISECHKDAEDCSLSDILEKIGGVPHRYYLSERACQGILRRHNERGHKQMPKILKEALKKQSKISTEEE